MAAWVVRQSTVFNDDDDDDTDAPDFCTVSLGGAHRLGLHTGHRSLPCAGINGAGVGLVLQWATALRWWPWCWWSLLAFSTPVPTG
jgi:hypothetical protein